MSPCSAETPLVLSPSLQSVRSTERAGLSGDHGLLTLKLD